MTGDEPATAEIGNGAMLDSIERALTDTSLSLQAMFRVWWPAEGNADARQETYLLHFAHALRATGWLTYADVAPAGEANQGIDLVAIQTERSWLLYALVDMGRGFWR